MVFPDYDVRYIAINDNVDTAKSENELLAFKNIFNDWYARDCSKKIRAVFKAKGQSGKHLCPPIYGYKKSDTDKNLWIVDETARRSSTQDFQALHRWLRSGADCPYLNRTGYPDTDCLRIIAGA